jgi:hypothetical protein
MKNGLKIGNMMDIFKKLSRLTRLPTQNIPGVFISKAHRTIRTSIERLFYSPKEMGGKDAGRSIPISLVNLIHPDVFTPGFSNLFIEKFPQDASRIIEKAQKAVDLKVDLLGSGEVDLRKFRDRKDLKIIPAQSHGDSHLNPGDVKGRVPWNFDFKSGVGWDPATFYADVRYGHLEGVDIKVPWELSRCQHFITMGQAYHLTQDEKYAESFFNQVDDWIEQNPVKFGVNWSSPMEVALRACNWIVGWEFFSKSVSKPDWFAGRFGQSLEEHGYHIIHHLEWGGGTSSNHYLANLLGLGYLGMALSKPKWIRLAHQELKKEIIKQTHSDGMDYEASTSYHRLVLEIFYYFSIVMARTDNMETSLAEKITTCFGIRYQSRLEQMFKFLFFLCDQQGQAPIIGDHDSGRVHVFLDRSDKDFRYLVSGGALLFKNSQLKVEGWEVGSEGVWLYGFMGLETLKSIMGTPSPQIPPKKPGPSGLGVLRGPRHHMVFSALKNGMDGTGGHTHNDKLSFTLSVGRDDFLVDPGSGVYTSSPKMRNTFRSTRMHNTVEVDGEEQNRLDPGDLFSIKNDAKVHVKVWEDDHVVASHDGYGRLRSPVIHEREIKCDSHHLVWIIGDKLKGQGQHRLTWRFILDSKIQASVKSNTVVLLNGWEGILELTNVNLGGDFRIETGFVSPSYGIIMETSIIQLDLTRKLPVDGQFEIKWSKKEPA